LIRSSPAVCGPRSIERGQDAPDCAGNLQHALQVVRVPRHPPAARLHYEVRALQAVERRLHLGLVASITGERLVF